MIQLPGEPKIVSRKENRAVLEISPLYPGYGTTIGNTLRRVLISSLEGAAVTAAKIKGVDHEFSSIPGVLEDVVEIIFNLKKIRFKLFKDEPVTLTLDVKGAREVVAADIKVTSDVEIVNPSQRIATITDKKVELSMEITIEKGIGYVPVEQRHKDKLSVGEIAIDGIFTPIRNVNFTVENIRVGQRTDYNKVLLDIETDGSVSPEETLVRAADILIEHFSGIKKIAGNTSTSEPDTSIESVEAEKEKKPKKKKKE